MPEIIERRYPTLVGIYSNNYHSVTIPILFKELDGLFDKFKITTSVVVFDANTSDESFKSKYLPSLAPYCQLVLPGNKLVDYSNRWTVAEIVSFVVPESQQTKCLKDEIALVQEKMNKIQKCMFKSKFVDASKDSLDVILAKCS